MCVCSSSSSDVFALAVLHCVELVDGGGGLLCVCVCVCVCSVAMA